MDFSPGRMALLVEGDVWVMRFPRISGTVNFVASRTADGSGFRIGRGPVVANVVELLEGMPPTRISALSDAALKHIFDRFNLGFGATDILESSSEQPLVKIARVNISAAVLHLAAGESH